MIYFFLYLQAGGMKPDFNQDLPTLLFCSNGQDLNEGGDTALRRVKHQPWTHKTLHVEGWRERNTAVALDKAYRTLTATETPPEGARDKRRRARDAARRVRDTILGHARCSAGDVAL